MSYFPAWLDGLFQSRRFWALAAGVLAVVVHAATQGRISEQDVLSLTGLLIAWVFGDSIRKTATKAR
jgi:hypothetical protein